MTTRSDKTQEEITEECMRKTIRKPNEFTNNDGGREFAYRSPQYQPVIHLFDNPNRFATPLPVQPDGTDNRDVLIEWLWQWRLDYYGGKVTHEPERDKPKITCINADDLLTLIFKRIDELGLSTIPGILAKQRAMREPEAPPQPLYRVTLELHPNGQPIVNRLNKLVTHNQAERIAAILKEAK